MGFENFESKILTVWELITSTILSFTVTADSERSERQRSAVSGQRSGAGKWNNFLQKVEMKKINFSVKSRPRESSDRLIRRFIKKAKKEKIVEKFRDRQRYEKPSVRKKIKSKKAQRQRERDAAKLKKRQKRNNRN